jgi:hypothetical protein
MTRKAFYCCEKSRIEADGEPVINAICHSGICKTRTGGAVRWPAALKPQKIILYARFALLFERLDVGHRGSDFFAAAPAMRG